MLYHIEGEDRDRFEDRQGEELGDKMSPGGRPIYRISNVSYKLFNISASVIQNRNDKLDVYLY